jgi:hypothetical protein
MWYTRLKSAYIESNVYGYWLLADGQLVEVNAGSGHIGALKQFGMSSNSEAFRKNMIRLITENKELWVQFEYLKPNQLQKSKLIEMARNWDFKHFIIDSDYLPEDRYEFDSSVEFIKQIRDIK